MIFDPKKYNVKKIGFSGSSTESIPIGGGDCGANVWIDKNGLNLLLSKTDTFAESCRLMKLGLLCISFETQIFSDTNKPIMELDLSDGTILLTDENKTAEIIIAAFVNQPLYGIKAETKQPNKILISLNNYRSKERTLVSNDESAYSYQYAPFPVRESADIVSEPIGKTLSWYHHNEWSYYSYTMVNQHLTEAMRGDPVLNRTFGCSVSGVGFSRNGDILESRKSKNNEIYILAGCEQTPAPANWSVLQAMELDYNLKSYNFNYLLSENRKWWTNYFTEYFINVFGTPEAEEATKGYTLQKYMQGCAGRGNMPIKFNGSIFTVHPSPYYTDIDYDYRRWGDPFWIQNTRLIYWNMLFSGDFEGMLPFFDLCYEIMPAARVRSKVRFGHNGINIPETFNFFGAFADSNYNYGKDTQTPPICDNTYIRWHYNGQLEISYMMLKFREFTEDKYQEYFEEKCIPFINESLQFFKEHFPKENGKMRIAPVSSLETWQDCVNDTPNIAGICAVIRGLKKIGKTSCIDENDLPEIPRQIRDGKEVISPCSETFRTNPDNCETAELYTMFPFDIYTFDMSEDEKRLLTDTFYLAHDKHVNGWSQRIEQAAILGMTDFCKENVVNNFRQKHNGCFFDAYFGPNFDWTPDQCHGSSTSIALTFMLLQSYEGKIKKFPAFPSDWKAEFRLPSSAGTIEEL